MANRFKYSSTLVCSMKKTQRANIIRNKENDIHRQHRQIPAPTRETKNQPIHVAIKSIVPTMKRRTENTMRESARRKRNESTIKPCIHTPSDCFFKLYHGFYLFLCRADLPILFRNYLFTKKSSSGREIPGREPTC